MEAKTLCTLPHNANGFIPRLSVSELTRRDRLSAMWCRQLDLPKRDPVESALCTCGSCAPSLRKLLQVGAQALADRQLESGGLSNGAPHSDPWAEVLP